jgi:orotate phosphoribosyltransferase
MEKCRKPSGVGNCSTINLDHHHSGLIETALQRNALAFGTFILSSKRVSPYLFNIARMNSGPATAILAEAYAKVIARNVGTQCTIHVYGVPEKGVPLVSPITVALDRLSRKEGYGLSAEWSFSRKFPKDHAEEGVFVGDIPPGSRVVMVDDVITTGDTKLKDLEKLKERGVVPEILVTALNRQEVRDDGKDTLSEFSEKTGIRVYSILKATDLVAYLRVQSECQKASAHLAGCAFTLAPYWQAHICDAEPTYLQGRINYTRQLQRMIAYLEAYGTEEALAELRR